MSLRGPRGKYPSSPGGGYLLPHPAAGVACVAPGGGLGGGFFFFPVSLPLASPGVSFTFGTLEGYLSMGASLLSNLGREVECGISSRGVVE